MSGQGGALNRNLVKACCFERSLIAVYGAVHDLMSEAKGALIWCCKSLANVHFLPQIEAGRFFSVSYEDLTHDSEKILRQMMHHFKTPFVEEMLRFNISEEARETAKCGALWANVQQSVIKNNTQKFLKEATQEQVRIFEWVAGRSLDRLGYDRMNTCKGESREFSAAEIRLFEAENEQLKKEVLARIDPSELRLRQPQKDLLKEIQARRKEGGNPTK